MMHNQDLSLRLPFIYVRMCKAVAAFDDFKYKIDTNETRLVILYVYHQIIWSLMRNVRVLIDFGQI